MHTNVLLLEKIQNRNITLNVASHLPEIFLNYFEIFLNYFEILNIFVTICDLIICTAYMAQRKQIVLMYQVFWAIRPYNVVKSVSLCFLLVQTAIYLAYMQ